MRQTCRRAPAMTRSEIVSQLMGARPRRFVLPTLAAIRLRQGWGTHFCGLLMVRSIRPCGRRESRAKLLLAPRHLARRLSRDRSRPGAAAREAIRTLISVESECLRSSAWRRAVGTLMARSPAIFPAPAPAGNESTSVALFLPRNCRFSRRMAASVVSSTVTWPRSFTAACASRRKRARVRADGMR